MVIYPDYEELYNNKSNNNFFPSLYSSHTKEMEYSRLYKDTNISQINKIDENKDVSSSQRDISNATFNQFNGEEEMSSDDDNSYTGNNNEEEEIFEEV